MEDGGKNWTVVQFVEEGSVEAVPSSWVNGDLCYWPPFLKPKIVMAIKKNEEANTHWPSFKIKMFRNSTFDDYQKARQKAKVAEDVTVSDLASETDNPSVKRRIVPRVYSSSDEDEDILNIPEPPTIKKQQSKKKSLNAHTVSSPPNLLSTNVTNVTETTIDQGKDEDKLNKKIQVLIEQNHILRSLVIEALQEVRELRKLVEGQGPSLQPDENFFTKFPSLSFPIQDFEQFSQLEDILANENDFAIAVKTISKLGGSNVYNIVKRIMSTLLTNEAALNFSFYGRKGKKPFNGTNMQKLISAAAMENTCVTNTAEIESAVGTWLRRASDRRSSIQKRFLVHPQRQ